MPKFKVIDLRAGISEPELHADARSPEQAAELALGLKLVRAGHPRNLVCRVYWQDADNTNMVRLYDRVSKHTVPSPAGGTSPAAGR